VCLLDAWGFLSWELWDGAVFAIEIAWKAPQCFLAGLYPKQWTSLAVFGGYYISDKQTVAPNGCSLRNAIAVLMVVKH
jgi:hypothetical protein